MPRQQSSPSIGRKAGRAADRVRNGARRRRRGDRSAGCVVLYWRAMAPRELLALRRIQAAVRCVRRSGTQSDVIVEGSGIRDPRSDWKLVTGWKLKAESWKLIL